MGRSARKALKNAYTIVMLHGHTRASSGKYLQLRVFTKYVSELDVLKRTFGGYSYKHGTGFKWTIAKRDDLIKLYELTEKFHPSQHGWEDLIREHYIRQKEPTEG